MIFNHSSRARHDEIVRENEGIIKNNGGAVSPLFELIAREQAQLVCHDTG